MEIKIQLKHPNGKRAISIEKSKYDALKMALLDCLKSEGGVTHTEMFQAITKNFDQNNIPFEGSVEWYMQWVKLDLEARKQIKKTGGKSPIKYVVTGV